MRYSVVVNDAGTLLGAFGSYSRIEPRASLAACSARPRSAIGDEGVAGLGVLRYDWPRALGAVVQVQLYVFAAVGMVANRASGSGDQTLASSGAGLRADVTRNLDFDLEVAVPLTDPRYDTGGRTPRINLQVSQSF